MKPLIKFIVICFLPVSVFAQSPVLSLDSIISNINRNNLMLQSYELQAESYKHKADAATAWMAPMAGIGTFMTPYPGEKAMSPAERGSIMVQLEQDIPNPLKLRARKKYLGSQGDVVAAGREITLNDLRAQAKRYYYNWIIAKYKIAVLNQNEKLMTTMKKVEEVRYPFNQSQLSGIYQIDARLEDNRNMIRMQEGIVARSRAVLKSLMNADASYDFEIDSIVEPHFVPEDVTDTAAIAYARKDIFKMDENIRSMQLNIASMRKEKHPDFRIRFDHMNPLSGVMPKAFSVMGMISIPIAPWSSKMYRSEIKAMEYNIKGMEKERSGMLLETKGMLLGMQAELQTMHERVLAMEEKIIPALQKALDANYILYQENKLGLAVVIDSWEALNMMHMNLLDEKLKHYEMLVDYEKELFR